MSSKVVLYDTTLRDGTQGEGISFSLMDKLFIAERLDRLGIHYIEGGWPGSNPKDMEFFESAKSMQLETAKITAFGSTRRANTRVEKDANVITLLQAETKVITIFGKSWILHVKDVLKTSPDENVTMIADTVRHFKSKGKEMIYDAEHFFDGYKDSSQYALRTLKAAEEAGADTIVLCDTNGGSTPLEIQSIIKEVRKSIKKPLGIHTHNDAELAVANSLVATQTGIVHIQGTINGYGERCGNANLCSIIPSLKLKLGIDCIPSGKLKELYELSRYVDELANRIHDSKAPYVGESAFAHKGGMHVNAVQKNPRSFEHIQPEYVGNRRRILISELSGASNILLKAKEVGVHIDKDNPRVREILHLLKRLEHEGYEFEAAEGSFELLLRRQLHRVKKYFELKEFRVIVEKRGKKVISEATTKVKVNGTLQHTAAEGDGPVNAMDNALRKALERFYPSLEDLRLIDFKVRAINAKAGTAARVRVLIESKDSERVWGTVGVSENIIHACWDALVDSVVYKLMKDKV